MSSEASVTRTPAVVVVPKGPEHPILYDERTGLFIPLQRVPKGFRPEKARPKL